MSLNHFVFNLFFSCKIMTTVESENWRLCVVEVLCQVFFFLSFFLTLIIKHHNLEPNYLNDIKYTEPCKKSVLAVEEAFKTNSSPSNIARLFRELFCTSVVLASTLVPLFLSQYPAHIPEVFWTFLAPSRVPWLLAPAKPWAVVGWTCFD